MRALLLLLLISSCAAAQPPQQVVVCLGDSETYGRGLVRGDDYPSQLETLLGPNWKVINAGISGDTTRGMLTRLQEDALSFRPSAVIVMGGENDIFYGYDVTTQDPSFQLDAPTGPKSNIKNMVVTIQMSGAQAIVGTILPHGTIETTPARAQATAQLREWELAYFPQNNVPVIDFYASVENPELLGYSHPDETLDNVHPSELGALIMAQAAFGVLTR